MAPAFSTWKGQPTGKASRTFRSQGMAASSRSSALAGKRFVRPQARSSERKYLNNSIGSYNAWDTTGQVSDIGVVPTGTSVNTRVGKMVNLTGVQIRGTVKAASLTLSRCALLLVYDREPNGAALPGITDILQSASSNAQTNRDNAPRFKIVRRWDFAMTGSAGAANPSDNVIHLIDDYVPLKFGKYPQKYTAANTDGSNTGRIKGGLYLVTIGDVANGTTTPTGSIATRVEFEDV